LISDTIIDNNDSRYRKYYTKIPIASLEAATRVLNWFSSRRKDVDTMQWKPGFSDLQWQCYARMVNDHGAPENTGARLPRSYYFFGISAKFSNIHLGAGCILPPIKIFVLSYTLPQH
jgi:hypothetical protein